MIVPAAEPVVRIMTYLSKGLNIQGRGPFKMQLFKFMGFSAAMFNDSECIHGDLWRRDTVSLIAVRQRPERPAPGEVGQAKVSPLTLNGGSKHQTCISISC